MAYTDFIAFYALCWVKHQNTKKTYKPKNQILIVYVYLLMNTFIWFSEMLSK